MLEAKCEKPQICVFSDKYKYDRTNICKKSATKKPPALGGASSWAAATPTPTMVDVHWPDDAAVVSVADTQIQQIQMLTNANTANTKYKY